MKRKTDSASESTQSEPDPVLDSAKVLSLIQAGGLLTKHFSGFQPRAGQQSMMQCVLQAYEKNALALIEAGTGIGKSIAYLIPAILWAATTGERTAISTHTIPLQEQLLQKDIPLLMKTLGLEMKVSLVKGMSNYICLRKWSDVMDQVALLPPQEADELLKMEPWVDAQYTNSSEGSLSRLPILPSRATWERISVDRETCTGRACPEYAKCPLIKDRAAAKEAQILVVNHHMLLTDLAMRASPLAKQDEQEEGLLPSYVRLILDEAHHLEDVARDLFAEMLSQRQIFRLLSYLSGEKHGRLSLLRMQLTKWSLKKKGDFSTAIAQIHQRLNVDIPSLHHDVFQALTRCFLDLERYMQAQTCDAETSSEKGEQQIRLRTKNQTLPVWTEQLFPTMQQAADQIRGYCTTIEGVLQEFLQLDDPSLEERTRSTRQEIKNYLLALNEVGSMLQSMQKPFVEHERVRWLYKKSFAGGQDIGMVEASLDMTETLRKHLFQPMRTAVLCSATLTTDGNFDFLRGRLGLTQEMMSARQILEERQLSPFAYATQALFAVPSDLPDPAVPEFFDAAVESIWRALEASQGNALVLFTSYRMLLAAFSALKERCSARRFPLLRQGEASRSFLLEALRKDDHSVLFATYSFWEGVDIVGEAVRCVIIVKLPFPVPKSPLFEAESERLLAQGKNPFMELSVPMAMIRFIQGFGRLIRSQRDRGCVLCFDTRLITRGYGTRFLRVLPPCRQVLDKAEIVWQEMVAFYRKTHYLTKK